MVLQMMESLDEHIVRQESNATQNKKLWDIYAVEWATNASWVRGMAEGSGREGVAYLGEEWSNSEAFEHVLHRFVLSRCRADMVAAEIGSGGGRVARRVLPLVRELHCFDVSEKMLQRCREALGPEAASRCQFEVLGEDCQLPLGRTYDLIYFFDVLVHVDPQTQFRYYAQLSRALKPDGLALVHTANLAAPLGWDRFVKQRQASVGGFCFVTPDMVTLMLRQAGLEIVERSWPRPVDDTQPNVYLDRDFFAVVRVPATSQS